MIFRRPDEALAGSYTVLAVDSLGNSHFSVDLSVGSVRALIGTQRIEQLFAGYCNQET